MHQPQYETEIRTKTETSRINTFHTNYIDWENFPFDDPKHTATLCGTDEQKSEWIERQKEYLRICEGPNARASNYGGWPRIWHEVIQVGMASAWPYWSPRPTVLVQTFMGAEWIDFMSLTGAEAIAPTQPISDEAPLEEGK